MYFVAEVFPNLSRRQGKNLSFTFLAKNRDLTMMAMVPRYLMVHSQVAVLLAVGAARSCV